LALVIGGMFHAFLGLFIGKIACIAAACTGLGRHDESSGFSQGSAFNTPQVGRAGKARRLWQALP